MKNLKLLILSIFTVFLFVGCTVLPAVLGAAFEPNFTKKQWLEKLMNESKKVLLSEDEKVRAAKNICACKHLDKDDLSTSVPKDAEKFCKLEEDDKIYYIENITSTYDMRYRMYVLVRDDTPFESIGIRKKYSKELRKFIFVTERLH